LWFLISPCGFAVSATGNETQIPSVKLMPMVDRPQLNFFSQGYHIIYSICWQNRKGINKLSKPKKTIVGAAHKWKTKY